MNDHGGNATPVWFLAARALFAPLPASAFALGVGVGLDVALVLLAFAALAWAYGWRTSLVAMTAFGAIDFYQFGSNWFGAALRHDWLALWLLGVAALKRRWFATGAALLTWAALIRAFPALAFVTLAMPLAWAAVGRGQADWRAALRGALGAVVAGAVLFVASAAVFGIEAWPEWLRKISLLNDGDHVNNISIKTYLVTHRTAWLITALGVVALLAWALRDAPLDEAAAWGAALIGVVFNPANYYLHVMCVLAVVGSARGFSRGSATVLLGMCAACYATTLTGRLDAHFRAESWVMAAGVSAMLVLQLVSRRRRPPGSPPAVAPTSTVVYEHEPCRTCAWPVGGDGFSRAAK